MPAQALPLSAPNRMPCPCARMSVLFPACHCYTRSSLSPSFQLFRGPSRHKCLRVASSQPTQHSISRAPPSCVAYPSLLLRFPTPNGHTFHCRYLQQFNPGQDNQLSWPTLQPSWFVLQLSGWVAIWPILKPSDSFEMVQVLNCSLT